MACSVGCAGSESVNSTVSEPHDEGTSKESELPFFTNYDCPHFPCHAGVAPETFNCLFCFCPLYALGPACGGSFTYTAHGVKSCANCSLPHQGNNGNAMVNEKFSLLAELAKA